MSGFDLGDLLPLYLDETDEQIVGLGDLLLQLEQTPADEKALRDHACPALSPIAGQLGVDPLDLVLYGGEDYALVVASPVAIDGFWRVGVVEEGGGVWLTRGTAREELVPRGFDHFAR